ncbi:hypothetical protein C1645_828922 [Glomus cerebriforme]|uniref:Uncharacterized protein n=1 Tax=Glomus cerebriforme TaxID=658196 RepID=A0A397SVD5_9GLOM|nr:hypothetical protein C1645_828922 [Glomus cerebriforme]
MLGNLISIALWKIYYQPVDYQRNAKKLLEVSLNIGYIPRASFSSITTPNEVHQADVLYMPYDKIGRILTSATIARALKEKYDNPECPLTWPEIFLSDKDPELEANEKLLKEYSDASDLLTLRMNKISQSWVRNLPIVVKDINNSITYGPIGFDEEKLSGDVLVRYLIDTRELEAGLYWLEEVPFGLVDDDDYVIKRPERSFVREELQVIPFDTELPLNESMIALRISGSFS